MTALDFTLPAELEVHEPPEARGLARDSVRLLVGSNSTGEISHHRFTELPDLLRPRDVLVVNTSGTLPAERPWPPSYYQTVFATHPGSAEMPSASRPFTDRIVIRLVTAGVQLAPVLLHTGVAAPETHERPNPERFAVPATSARIVNQAKAAGGRIIAIGTTAVRALESATNPDGVAGPAQGCTDLIITPERGTRVVDGLLTGFHEPRASHLDMLAAIADSELLDQCYAQAIEVGYLWHEFGDVNLLLP